MGVVRLVFWRLMILICRFVAQALTMQFYPLRSADCLSYGFLFPWISRLWRNALSDEFSYLSIICILMRLIPKSEPRRRHAIFFYAFSNDYLYCGGSKAFSSFFVREKVQKPPQSNLQRPRVARCFFFFCGWPCQYVCATIPTMTLNIVIRIWRVCGVECRCVAI